MKRGLTVGLIVVMTLGVLSGCSSTPGSVAAPSTQTPVVGSRSSDSAPGVSATQINVGAISSLSGPLAGIFGGLAPGMIAYFNMLNAQGGVNGRKIVLTDNLDDGGSPSQFTQDVHTLIDQDHVFAAAASSAWFTPGYFVATKTPTYGYNVSANWQNAPNLFAVGGSTQIYSAGFPAMRFFINKVGVEKVAFISYGPSIASSYDACNGYASGMKAAGVNVNFVDVGAQLGGSYSSDAQRLQQAGSQLVITCMQGSDNVTLARAIQQYGVKIKQLWLNGYDQTLLNQYSSLMQGVYFNNTGTLPFEAADTAKYGTVYSGMQAYISAMKKYEPKYIYNGIALQGWQSAALIAAGVKAAGNNVTQANVIAQTNKLTNFTGAGISAPVDWTKLHTGVTWPSCSAYIQVQGTKFVPVFGKGRQIFVCVGPSVNNPVPVTPPPGTPGA